MCCNWLTACTRIQTDESTASADPSKLRPQGKATPDEVLCTVSMNTVFGRDTEKESWARTKGIRSAASSALASCATFQLQISGWLRKVYLRGHRT